MADQEKNAQKLDGNYNTEETIRYFTMGMAQPVTANKMVSENYVGGAKIGKQKLNIYTDQGIILRYISQTYDNGIIIAENHYESGFGQGDRNYRRKLNSNGGLVELYEEDKRLDTYKDYRWDQYGVLRHERAKASDGTIVRHGYDANGYSEGFSITTVIDPVFGVDTYEHTVYGDKGSIKQRAGKDIYGRDYLERRTEKGDMHGYYKITSAVVDDLQKFITNKVTIIETMNGESDGMIYEYTADGSEEDVTIMSEGDVDMGRTLLAKANLLKLQFGDFLVRTLADDRRTKEQRVEARAKVMTKKFANE